MKTMAITSSRNPVIQGLRRAQAAGRPTEDGLVVVEGPHLLAEAIQGLWTVKQVFATPEARLRHTSLIAAVASPVTELSSKMMRGTAQTESTQGILALLSPALFSWKEISRQVQATSGVVVVLDGIQDPGNAGTIVRSAEAFGAAAIILTSGSVRIANSKFLRASAGSSFRMPSLEAVDAQSLQQQMAADGIRTMALAAHSGRSVNKVDWKGPCALVVGNEGAGISPALLQGSECCHIPTQNVESLNAGVACSLALYERSRHRNIL